MNCCINIVINNKPKVLTGLDQKVSGEDVSVAVGYALTIAPTGEQAGPKPSVC